MINIEAAKGDVMTSEYEYAGFIYIVVREGSRVMLTPKPGQHPAASKDKHVRAATECFVEEAT